MKTDVDALIKAKAFFRKWETIVLQADFPDELKPIIKLVDYWLSNYQSLILHNQLEKQQITEEEARTIFLDKHNENQLRILHDAEEDLYVLKEELQKKGVPAEEIRKIFKTVMEDIV